MKLLRNAVVLLVAIVVLALAQAEIVVGWDTSIAVTALLLGVAAIGLNLMFGYAGMLSLGNAIFFGIAGFGLGILVVKLGWPLWPSFALVIAVTVGLSILFGFILVRIPGLYFAVVTLGLAVAFEGLIRAFPATTGGASGLTIPVVVDLGFVEIVDETQWLWLSLIVVSIVLVVAWLVTWGKTGRILRLIRRDELAASVLGVNIVRAKLVVFVVAATMTGISGALFFLWQRVLVPESAGLLRSLELVTLAVVGGLGTLLGGLVGATTLTWIQELMRSQGDWTELTYGLAFLIVVLYAPRGVVGALSAGWRKLGQRLAGSRIRAIWRGNPQRQSRELSSRIGPLRESRPRPDGPGLVVEGVTRRFGGVRAVDDVTIAVRRGSLVGLIGANGAGKTTLMNVICGVETADAGSLVLDERQLSNRFPHEVAALGVARTFQVPRLVDDMSVLENVALGGDALNGRVFRKNRAEEAERLGRAMDALRRANLEHLANRPAGTLGTGERKYVELVRALAWDPAVLLMDEPAVGLSDAEIERLEEWLRELRRQGTAVLLVDHNLDFVERLVDYVYIMKEGSVTEQGKPSDILNRAGRQQPPAPVVQ